MYFRLETTIRGLWIEKRPIDFPYGGIHQITVSLRPPTEEEQKQGNEKDNAMCSAVSIRDPSSKIASMLDSLAKRKLPEDSRIPKEELSSAFDENGLLKMKYVVDFRVAPQPLESFARDVDRELWDYTRRTARVLRWRAEQNVVGPHNPFVNPRRDWSIDGVNWIPMSFGFGIRLEVLGSLRPTEQERNEVLEIVKNDETEPIGQELYREAWLQRDQNPRSALILGIAAAEVAVKHLGARLTPEAQWLLENVQTPPLVRMLREYVVKLPAKCQILGKTLPPPEEILDTLEKGVNLRNRIAHFGTATLEYETLQEILLAVRDVLWLLDYYAGSGWAMAKIRPNVREKLESLATA